MMPLPPDFKDFLKLLNQQEVEYLLIGGYAVAYYGYVRYTGDMDIFIRFSPENTAFQELTLMNASVVGSFKLLTMLKSVLSIWKI